MNEDTPCRECRGTGVVPGYETDKDCPVCHGVGTEDRIVRFEGETAWDAVVHHYSLNIEEEDDFISFLEAKGMAPGRCSLPWLQMYYREWRHLSQDC